MKLKWSGVICLGLFGLSGSAESVILDHRYCCGGTFEFQDVVRFAKESGPSLTGNLYSILITPSSSTRKGGVASSSEESVAFCFGVAVRLRHEESHAYLLKTTIGIAVHHWDSRRQVYRSEVLSGVDVYNQKFEAGRVAWIGDYLGVTPKLWLVSDNVLGVEEALEFSKQVMRTLGMSKAVTYVRTDPYFWPPDSCSPYSLPLQWRRIAPADDRGLSRNTVVCKVEALSKSDECVIYRSR